MSARAPAHKTTLVTLLALATVQTTIGVDISCKKDGLFANYDTECREYSRCTSGRVTGRYSCKVGREFSEAAGACVLRRPQPCVRHICAPGDTLAYATPGTACRQYYRCQSGNAVEHSCPFGAWFDLDTQACTRGAGTCYEPLCTGLPDGSYPDSSHECLRTLQCSGGVLQSVTSCAGRPCTDICPPARSSAIPLPAGDADFCSDETCSSICQHAENGAYADHSTGCREYYVCKSRRVIRRGVCEHGLIFAQGGCKSADQAQCPPARSPCFNRPDGLHRNWRDCSSWIECRRGRVVSQKSCSPGLVFDGAYCVPSGDFSCRGPVVSTQCEGLPSGTYQDFETNCTSYFHCEGVLRTMLSCPDGEVYNGEKCVPEEQYLCPSLERDSCYGRPDGRYRGYDTGCRGYYSCYNGQKAIYACPAGQMFNGESCEAVKPGTCQSDSCLGLTDGYHADLESGCKRYFYCEGGDRLATLSCNGGKIFDGHSCVSASRHQCGLPKKSSQKLGKPCERDGFFVQPGTDCKQYYFCVSGVPSYLSCHSNQVFNGQICVPSMLYTCPG
ncbi:chitin binding peritrophin-A domain-containing protein [Phthorimaea operculella]|nr:chitin binding peritrophin-A domain-containing protein [Phthorimaea operculella]